MPDDESTSARLARIAAHLPPDDAAFVLHLAPPVRQPARARLDERDAAIRAARSLWPATSDTAAARAIAAALSDYLGRGWSRERNLAELPEHAGPRRRALHRLARANDGRTLGYRQMLNVISGTRGR